VASFLGTVPSNECRSTGLCGAIKADSGLRSSATYANRVPRMQNTIATKSAQQWRKTVSTQDIGKCQSKSRDSLDWPVLALLGRTIPGGPEIIFFWFYSRCNTDSGCSRHRSSAQYLPQFTPMSETAATEGTKMTASCYFRSRVFPALLLPPCCERMSYHLPACWVGSGAQ